MKYIKLTLPEVRDYFDKVWFYKESYFDPISQVWFIPENYYESTT